MDFLELVKKRESCRSFDPARPVEQDKLDRCLEAVRLAPSACNSQPWKLVVVTDPELRKKIAEAADSKLLGFNHFVKQAQVLVVLVRETPNLTSKLGTLLKNKPYTLMDVGIAAEHFCLQATSEGLGTCMVGWFAEEKVKRFLEIPGSKRAELIIAVGYPLNKEPRQNNRKPVEKIRSYNKY